MTHVCLRVCLRTYMLVCLCVCKAKCVWVPPREGRGRQGVGSALGTAWLCSALSVAPNRPQHSTTVMNYCIREHCYIQIHTFTYTSLQLVDVQKTHIKISFSLYRALTARQLLASCWDQRTLDCACLREWCAQTGLIIQTFAMLRKCLYDMLRYKLN